MNERNINFFSRNTLQRIFVLNQLIIIHEKSRGSLMSLSDFFDFSLGNIAVSLVSSLLAVWVGIKYETIDYTYDARGNRKKLAEDDSLLQFAREQTYTFNVWDQLKTVTEGNVTTEFEYEIQGLRLYKKTTTGTTGGTGNTPVTELVMLITIVDR